MLRITPDKARRLFRDLRGLLLDLRDPDHPLVFTIARDDQEARSIRVEADTIVPCPLCGRGRESNP